MPLIENPNASTLTLSLPDSSRTQTRSPVHQLGSRSEGVDKDPIGARPLTLSDRQSHRSSINDNYCVSCVAGNVVDVCVTSNGTSTANCVTRSSSYACVSRRKELTRNQDCFVTDKKDTVGTLTVNSCLVVNHAHSATVYPQKKGVNPNYCCERCFLCRSAEFCTKCHKCPSCCT